MRCWMGLRWRTRTPECLAINPNGRIPTLIDGDLKLFESMAINHYLALRYDGGLRPRNIADEGRALMWSFWMANETEPLVRHLMRHRIFLHESDRDSVVVERAARDLGVPLAVLNDALADRTYLLGDTFCVADVNLAFGLFWLAMAGIDMNRVPNVTRWLAVCADRPAQKIAQGGTEPTLNPEDMRERGEPDPRYSDV
jgi:glutathione S-transferase